MHVSKCARRTHAQHSLTPLHAAAEHGYAEVVTLLLANGAAKDATDVVCALRFFSPSMLASLGSN